MGWVFRKSSNLLLLASAVYLYLLLFVPLFSPFAFSTDGGIFLADARRMLDGDVLYRDFFQFVTPGADLVYYSLFKLLGPHVWIPNFVLLVMGVGFVWLSIVIGRRVLSPRSVLLPGALFVVVSYGTRLDHTHNWYSGLAAVAALAVLIEKRTTARIAAAGAFCGLAACFTQSRGPAAALGLAVFLLWECRRNKENWRALLRKEGSLLAGFVVPVVAVNAYFVWKAGLQRFLYCTVVFVLKYYPAQATWNTYRAFTEELPSVPPWSGLLAYKSWFFLYALIPAIYLLLMARYWRESRKRAHEPWDRLMLLAIFGLFLFLGIAPAPALIRVAAGSVPALILLAWFVDSPRPLDRVLSGVLWTGVLVAAVMGVYRRQSGWYKILDAPGGRLATLDELTYDRYDWLLRSTRPGEYVYVPYLPEIYFYLDRRNPTPLTIISNTGFTRPAQVAEAIRGLDEHDVKYVLWSAESLDYYEPGLDPRGDNLWPLRNYLRDHYHVAKRFGPYGLVFERIR